MRLAHFLSRAGVTSRRKAEELIKKGLVQVNGEPAIDPALNVESSRDRVTIEGEKVDFSADFVYYLLHKPKGVVTSRDAQGDRKSVFDLVPPKPRVFAAGRLEEESSGLLLLTNDGDIVQKLTHPRYGVRKVYHVVVDGELTTARLQKLIGGIHLAEGKVFGKFHVLKRGHGFSVMDVTLTQGVNRQVQRMLAKVGLRVRDIVRTEFGPFSLLKLPVGAFQILSPYDVKRVVSGLEQNVIRRSPAGRGPRRR
jgi:23S rRNA pseudouridine2605 synthase